MLSFDAALLVALCLLALAGMLLSHRLARATDPLVPALDRLADALAHLPQEGGAALHTRVVAALVLEPDNDERGGADA